MAYNPNNQGNKSYSKPAAAAAPATPAPAKAQEEGVARKPVGSLHVQGKDEEKKTRLTGLFKEVSKNGATYYRGNTEDGTKYIIFLD